MPTRVRILATIAVAMTVLCEISRRLVHDRITAINAAQQALKKNTPAMDNKNYPCRRNSYRFFSS
jgi:hypothetical protein